MDQHATWYGIMEVGLGPSHIVLVGDSAPHHGKRYSSTPTFSPMSIVAKRSPISAIAVALVLFLKIFIHQTEVR